MLTLIFYDGCFATNIAQEIHSNASAAVTLTLVGDISFSRGIAKIIALRNQPNFPFEKIKAYLKNSDFVFGNLETPIIPGRIINSREMVFRSDPGVESALKQTNFSIVSLANNHTTNFGSQGLIATINYLRAANIKYVGAGIDAHEAYQAQYLQKNKIKIAFLAFAEKDFIPPYFATKSPNGVVAIMDSSKMVPAVQLAKKNADFVIVSMHSGTEYKNQPTSTQINFARSAIDAGADFVVGQHPHVVQTMEKYRGKYIFYSLGNFVFDQKFSKDVRTPLMLKLHIYPEGLSKIELEPLYINDHYQPEIASDITAKTMLARLNYKAITDEPLLTWDVKTNSYHLNSHYVIANTLPQNTPTNIEIASPPLSLLLNHGKMLVKKHNQQLWESPPDFKIDSARIADITHSGQQSIIFSLWKPHNFGASKPFWIKDDKTIPRNHLFIYHSVDDKIKPIWGSSNLDAPNCKFEVADLKHDGKNELITLEGDYADFPACHGKYIAVWQWNGWGFTNIWRSPKGNFSNFILDQNN